MNAPGSAFFSANSPVHPDIKHGSESMEQPYVYNENTGQGRCYVCDIVFTSSAHAKQHLAGTKHDKREREWKRRNNLLETTANSSLEANALDEFLNLERETEEYTFNGITGFCKICDVDFTSYEHATQHLQGRKHKKKAGVVRFSSEASFSTACSTPSALNKLTTNAVGRGESVQPSACLAVPIANNFICQVCQVMLNTPEQLKLHQQSPKHKTKEEQLMASTSAVAIGRPATADRTEWFECIICSRKVNSREQLQIHLKSHNLKDWEVRNILERTARAGIGSNNTDATGVQAGNPNANLGPCGDTLTSYYTAPENPLSNAPNYCHVCNVSLNTAIQLEIHKQSPKHLKKEQQRSASMLARAEGRQVSADNTVWFTCVHCRSKLNSKDQLRTHLRSHGIQETEVAILLEQQRGSVGQSLKSETVAPMASLNTTSFQTAAMPLSARLDGDVTEQCSPLLTHSSSNELVELREFEGRLENEMSLSECLQFSCHWHCVVCDYHCRNDDAKIMHKESQDHISKLRIRKTKDESKPVSASDVMNTFGSVFTSKCETCNVPFCNSKDVEIHMKGQQHQKKMLKAVKVPFRVLPPVAWRHGKEECLQNADLLIKKKPRQYQKELYVKCMLNDAVCFLPTGAGKTLVSAMVISDMLTLNPARPVLFLVDRVLLVAQQGGVLREELGTKLFLRTNLITGDVEHRTLRIAEVCSGLQVTEGRPVWQSDVIVVTAAYMENMLSNEAVRWSDFSLVVFDEAHHCVKDHPFNRLLKDQHNVLSPVCKPRVLGLTASPAGCDSVDQTIVMLHKLLINMGDVTVAYVVENENELNEHRSVTALEAIEVTYSAKEKQLFTRLSQYLHTCLDQVSKQSNDASLKQYLPQVTRMSGEPTEVSVLTDLQEKLEQCTQPTTRAMVASPTVLKTLCKHLIAVIKALIDLIEIGFLIALNTLQPLMDEKREDSLYFASCFGVHGCDEIGEFIRDNKNMSMHAKEVDQIEDIDDEEMPTVKELLYQISKALELKRNGPEKGLVLVLVKTRAQAHLIAHVLQKSKLVTNNNLKVTTVVGHAAGSSDGMDVKQQARTLRQIQCHVYHIVVATSVAEEGIDLPLCSLVIQMDPPNHVTSLVQVRGRARQRRSKLIVLCRDRKQKMDIEQLMSREQNMNKAVEIVANQKQRNTFLRLS